MKTPIPFRDYYQKLTKSQKEALADRAGTSVNHLSQVAHSHRRAGLDLFHRLQWADKRITLDMLRPDLVSENTESASAEKR